MILYNSELDTKNSFRKAIAVNWAVIKLLSAID
jgi:hypothetical protein